MSKVVFSSNSKHVEIETIADFKIAERAKDFVPYNVMRVESWEGAIQNLDKAQLNYFITRLQQMEKLL